MSDERSSHAGSIGYWSAVSIGIGGMVGGGIFAVLGLAVQLARGGTPVAFLLAGLIALLASQSYARLSVAFPGQGGTVEFLNRAFGSGAFTGSLNVMLWLSYTVMLALYAFAFGSYGATFFPAAAQPIARHALITTAVILLTALNATGASQVGEAEEVIVGLKLLILLFFVAVGMRGVDPGHLAPSQWAPAVPLLAGGMVIFLAYEGFELIANTAADVANAARTLPRAYYTAVIFVVILYVLVSAVAVGSLPVDRIVAAKDYALAEAARPALDGFGFTLIAIAAMLSTGSAINATLYGASRFSYIIARDGELPTLLEHKVWHRPIEGLLITAVATILVANFFDLSSISLTGSAGFLVIFAAVCVANARLRKETGSGVLLPVLGAVACLLALVALGWQVARTGPTRLLVPLALVALSAGIELSYRAATGRTIHLSLHAGVPPTRSVHR